MLQTSIGNVVQPVVVTNPFVDHMKQQQLQNVVVPVKEVGGLFSSMSQQDVPKTRAQNNNKYQSSNLFASMSKEEVSTKSRVKQAPGGTSSFSLY